MLSSPRYAVLGCHDLAAAAAFLSVLGYTERGRDTLDTDTATALYGLTGPAEEVLFLPEGADTGGLLLVAAPEGSTAIASGGYAVDVYTRDIEASVAELTAAGGTPSPIARWELGGRPFAECGIIAPGGIRVVLVEGSSRRASILDHDETRRHSELQAAVHLTYGCDAAFWTALGLESLYSQRLVDPAVAALIGIDDLDAEIVLDLFWDGQGARVELISFPGLDLPKGDDAFKSGMHAGVFPVADLDAAHTLLTGAGAKTGPVVKSTLRGGRAFTATSPDGVDLEFWTA
ncbi:VOC family protein [Actinomadura sp. 7K507]|uniref:VOC family protein n=1 Tax=Actinomadura sp. 7K507 TaxID=2530365 RepID=UPI0010479DB1|nr:VOC family protein [Actinomadura sp. 7K507]TDC98265.1 VOC family protein [Actinomadura sp. 7K507]